jgi:RNA polymerase sigma-70 factor (ECF subfamily)
MNSVCEEKTFQSLYNHHIKEVRNFLYYKCGDYDLSDDLAQESYIKMWENCATVIFESAKGFLFTVANRLFLNKVRRDKVELSFIKTRTSNHNNENPEFLMEENEFKTKLEAAISALPEKQRAVFLMNRIDNMSYKEIAATLEISVKAVEKRISICLKTLKNNVSELRLRKI